MVYNECVHIPPQVHEDKQPLFKMGIGLTVRNIRVSLIFRRKQFYISDNVPLLWKK